MKNVKKTEIREIRRIIDVATVAIPKERDARAMYQAAAAQAPGELSKRVFEDLAQQEAGHESRLVALIAMLEDRLAELENDSEEN